MISSGFMWVMSLFTSPATKLRVWAWMVCLRSPNWLGPAAMYNLSKIPWVLPFSKYLAISLANSMHSWCCGSTVGSIACLENPTLSEVLPGLSETKSRLWRRLSGWTRVSISTKASFLCTLKMRAILLFATISHVSFFMGPPRFLFICLWSGSYSNAR